VERSGGSGKVEEMGPAGGWWGKGGGRREGGGKLTEEVRSVWAEMEGEGRGRRSEQGENEGEEGVGSRL